MQSPANKISYLEGIRGIAAFLVFGHHFLLAFFPAYYSYDIHAAHLPGAFEITYGQSLFSFLTNGNFYVRIFFVLSGYVLSRKYFRQAAVKDLVSAAQRRFIRLYVPVAATLVLSYVLIVSGAYKNVAASGVAHSEWWFGNMWVMDAPLGNLLQCLSYRTMFYGDNTFDTCLRTMSIEFYGSLLVFAFLALTHDTRSRKVLLLAVFLYFCLTGGILMCTFLFGISLNYVEVYIGRRRAGAFNIVSVLLLIVACILGAYPPDVVAGTFYSQLPAVVLGWFEWFHVVGAFLLVLAFVISPFLQRLVSSGVFRFLGYISFSLYLLHPLIIGTICCYVLLAVHDAIGYNLAGMAAFVAGALVCCALAWSMTKYVDNYAIRLARTTYEKWSERKADK